MNDPYTLHRLALAPLLNGPAEATTPPDFDAIATVGLPRFSDFLIEQGLGPLWHDLLSRSSAATPTRAALTDTLKASRTEAAAHYAIQKHALTELRSLLDSENIAHAVYKGVSNREALYEQPALRPAADIDLLVTPEDRDRAVNTLARAGYRLDTKPENISHEANLQKGPVTVDLHWDILRPGRTRQPLARFLVTNRIDAGDHWAMNDAGALCVALLHPVFAKYATAPQSTLIRMLDLWHLVRRVDAHADALQLLEFGGIKTAAWIMLRWLSQLTNNTAPHDAEAHTALVDALAPGATRQRYLDWWRRHNMAARLDRHPLAVQLGFTIAAHDRTQDAIGALGAIRRAKHTQAADMKNMQLAAASQSDPNTGCPP